MPTSAIQSQLKQHQKWLVGLHHEMTLAKIRTELQNQKGLTASSSQLEIFFRNLGLRKNLTRHEWKTVFCALDSQQLFGHIFDVYLSKNPITGQTLQNKRKNAKPARPLASCLDDANKLLTSLPDKVEFRPHLSQDSPAGNRTHRNSPHLALPTSSVATQDGETMVRLDIMSTTNSSMSAPSAVVPKTGAGSSSFSFQPWSIGTAGQVRLDVSQANMETYSDPGLEFSEGLDFMSSSSLIAPNYSHLTEDVEMDFGDPDCFLNPDLSGNWPGALSPVTFLPSLESHGSANQNDLLSTGVEYECSRSITVGQQINDFSLGTPIRLPADSPGCVTFRRGRSPQHQLLPTIKEVLKGLQSFSSVAVAAGDFCEPFDSIGAPGLSENGYAQLFLFSVVNNFAGTHPLPKAHIIHLINQPEIMRTTILSHLDTGASTIFSTALAEKLLEPAIEAGDAKTVHHILGLKTTRPDDIVCTIRGEPKTLIEKAASLRHFDIVSLLLQFGADVNKTYGDNDFSEQGALECAIGLSGEYRPIDLMVVDMLLENGATVSERLAGAVVRWGDIGLVEKVLSKLYSSKHECFFSYILLDVAEHLTNDIGYGIIQRVLWTCRNSHANKCLGSHQTLVTETMAKAARRKNEKLLELLLPYGGQDGLGSALLGAVRSGSHSLVHKLISQGACAEGPAKNLGYLYGMFPVTPLAEAIRGNDAELVETLVREGAWNGIGDHYRQAAVLQAIAESGNSAHLSNIN